MVVQPVNGVFIMNNGQEGLKSRRKKTIIVSILALILIVTVGIWVISSATKSGKKAATIKADSSKTETKNDETSNVTEVKNEQTPANPSNATSPSEQYVSNNQTQTQTQQAAPATTAPVTTTPVATDANGDIPTTGPSEVIFSALMLGVVATLATLNVQLIKQRQ
jgi:FtsZ-interacting cell division protein ZipA